MLCLETIKVYDGYSSLRKRLFRTLTVSKHCSKEELLLAAMKAFVVTQVLYNVHLLGTVLIEEDLQYVMVQHILSTPQGTAFEHSKAPALTCTFTSSSYVSKRNVAHNIHCTDKIIG